MPLHCISNFEGTSLWKFVGKISSQDLLFLVVFISFYISRYFPHIFRTSFNNIWKNVLVTNFPFLKDSLKPPTPLTAKIYSVWQKFFVDAPLLCGINSYLAQRGYLLWPHIVIRQLLASYKVNIYLYHLF